MTTIIMTGVLRRVAIQFNLLIDIPNKSRKFHSRPTPLTGGVGIISGIFIGCLSFLLIGNYIFFSSQNELAYQTSIQITEKNDPEVFEINLNLNSTDNTIEDVLINGQKIPLSNFDLKDQGNGIFEVRFGENELQRFAIKDQKIISLDTGEIFNYQDKSKLDLLTIDIFLQGLTLACLALLAMTIFDDFFQYGLNPLLRMFIQVLISLALIFFSDTSLNELGFSILNWEVNLGILSVPFTVFAVIGITNAFNMIDGINGLCSSLVMSCMAMLLFISFPLSFGYIFIIVISSLIGFLMYNLGLFGRQRRVFLGDNGSVFLGFLSAWFCIYFSSPSIGIMEPVTALWLVSIPLIDCVSIIIYRLSIGRRPFQADRNHLHHLIYDKLNMIPVKSHRESLTLITIFCLSIIFGVIGITLEKYSVSMNTSLILIITLGLIYHTSIRKLLRN